MRETPSQYFSDHIHHLFAELKPEDVEQFYISYQQWLHQQQISSLQAKIHSLQRHIAENTWRLHQVHPSPIALAILARLQSKGVNDIELLDRLLERGDIWLDQTMQHLEYCEQLDFMRDNYTEWCRNALDGAFDWMDSIQNGDTDMPPSSQAEETMAPVQGQMPVNGTSQLPMLSEGIAGGSAPLARRQQGEQEGSQTAGDTIDATEEALLQKLMSEGVEEEEAASLLETTLKMPLASPSETSETQALDVTEIIEEAATVPTMEKITPIEEADTIPTIEETQTDHHEEAVVPVEIAEQAVESAAPGEITAIEQSAEAIASIAPVETSEAEQTIEDVAPTQMAEVEQPVETDVSIKDDDGADEADEAEQLQETAISIEEPPEEQQLEEEAIIYFVDDLETLPLEILAEPVAQEAELEQNEYVSEAEELLPVEADVDVDASLVPVEQAAELEHAAYVPTPEEDIPSEVEEAEDASIVKGHSDYLRASGAGEAPLQQASLKAPAVHEQDSPAPEDSVPAAEVTDTSDLPAIEDDEVAPRSEKELSGEESEAVAQVVQQKSPQKRTFLQRLFSIFRSR